MKKNNIHLSGVMTARTPIMHVSGSSQGRTYAIKTTVQTKNEAGDTELKQVPYIQGSSFRGRLRDEMAEAIAEEIESKGELLDLATAMRLFSGGQMKTEQVLTLEDRRHIAECCLDLRLFGGIWKTMFPSTIRFGNVYPIIDATLDAGMVPGVLREFRQEDVIVKDDKVTNLLDAWVIQRRHDEILEGDPSAIKYLSEEGLAEAEEYIMEGMKNQDKRAEARKNDVKNNGTKKSILKHYASIQVIPAGTKMFSEIHLVNADDEAVGLALAAFERWLKAPYLGSASRSGYGNVSVNYDLSANDEIEVKDFIHVNDDGTHTICVDEFGQDCVDAYQGWLENASAKSLTAPSE